MRGPLRISEATTPDLAGLIVMTVSTAMMSRALRVCFVSHSGVLFGAERSLLELVRDLIADHGVTCMVVVPNAGPLEAQLMRLGAKCLVSRYTWWCGTKRRRSALWRGLGLSADVNKEIWGSAQSFQRSAMPAIRQFDPDVIWTQTMVVPWGAMAAAQLRKPHVWYVTEYGERDHGFKFDFAPLSVIASDILASSDLVYTCSKSVAETLFSQASSDHVRTLYCHIAPAPEPVASPDCGIFSIPGAVKLGIFSQIMASKGQEDIVRAVGLLTSHGRNVELAIVGDGFAAYKAHLQAIVRQHGIENRVKFTGLLSDVIPVLFPVLRQIDIAVICSRAEAFGRVGVEAMLLGKPTVYPNKGGVVEYMVEGQTGYSYTPGDPEQLADRLERLLADPRERDRMGRFGRTRAEQLFTKEQFSGAAWRALNALAQAGRKAKSGPSSLERLMARRRHVPPASAVATQDRARGHRRG